MKKVVKDTLENIVGKEINNQYHAVILLKQKLKALGGEDYIDIADEDMSMLLEFIEIFDPSVSQHITQPFKNALNFGNELKRVGKVMKPKDKKMDMDLLHTWADSIVKMHEDLKFDFNKEGFVILTKDNLTICTARKWMLIEGPVREFSGEIIFNQVKELDRITSILGESRLDGKLIKTLPNEGNRISIKYFTTVELIDAFADKEIVKEICLKIG